MIIRKIIQMVSILILNLAMTTAFAEVPPARILVSTIIEQQSSQLADMQGILYFDKVSGLSTEVDGLVKTIYFSKGDTVKAGDILIRLNTDFIDKDIRLKKEEIHCIDIKIEHTEKNLKRYENLFNQDAASETDYENLSYSHRELIKKRDALNVSLEKIRLKKNKSILRAPFDGIILEKTVDLGAWVSHGMIFCKIGSTRDLFVNVPINENLLKFIKIGSPMEVTINAYDRKVTGRVEGILPLADKKTKSVSLKVRIPDQSMTVANMSATACVPTSVGKSMKLVPRDALVSIDGKNFIYTVIENRARRLPLDVLFYKGDHACSDTPDVLPGMVVVIDGNQRLKDNQQVTIVGDRL